MRQTSEAFMNELLKDNTPKADTTDQHEQIAKIIDDKIDQAFKKQMEKFSVQVSKVNEPEATVETPEETENETVNDSNEGEENE